MGQSVEVVTSELQLAAERLRSSGQRLQDGLSSVDLETSNLLASGWKGEAATAFEKYWDQWHSGAGQVVRALQTMSDALRVAATNYAATDENAGGALDSTMQGAGGGSGGSGAGGGASGGSGSQSVSGSGAGSGSAVGQQADLAQQMNLGEVMQPMSQAVGMPAQTAGQLTGGLMQAGTTAAGMAQQVVQMATELAQQAEAAEQDPEAEPDGAAAGTEPAAPAPVDGPAEPAADQPTARKL